MDCIDLTCYKNWSIKIECERYEVDARDPAYAAIAIVTYTGVNSAFSTSCPECFVVNLPGELFFDFHKANLAIQREARRRIDALPIHLPSMFAARM
jgi:hypothetical protein